MNNNKVPHFDTFSCVFDHLGAYVQLKDNFTSPFSAPSPSAYTDILLRNSTGSLSHFLKTLINIINFNDSSTSHFAKVTSHDFTDLHVKICFYGGESALLERGQNRAQ